MGEQTSILEAAALGYFGKMAAANSHEVKNALAIINENAGLLEDLVMMAARGRSLDPDRLMGIAGKIRQQVARADRLANNSNRLAHSMDDPDGPTNLVSSLTLALNLADRYAAMAQIEVEILPGPAEISLPLSTFRVLHLLWTVLEFALEHGERGGRLTLRLGKSSRGAELRLGPVLLDSKAAAAAFGTTAQMHALLDAARCDINFEPQGANIILGFRHRREG